MIERVPEDCGSASALQNEYHKQSLASRHIGHELLARFIATQTPVEIPLVGGRQDTPQCHLRVDPNEKTLAVRFFGEFALPDVSRYRNILVQTLHLEGGAAAEFSIRSEDLHEVYSIVRLIADKVQFHGVEFGEAVAQVLDIFHDALAFRGALSPSDQVGLFGELKVLQHLSSTIGKNGSVGAWTGPGREEHDFVLADADLEVKTTTNESRLHWISSTRQLMPSPGRPLFLVSIQLTTGGEGAGQSLPELVKAVLDTSSVAQRTKLEEKLGLVDYRFDDVDLYVRRYKLRSTPALYRVDSVFPALTPERLSRVIESIEALRDCKYQLSLDCVEQDVPSPAFWRGAEDFR
jgi:hypothetical protein